MNETDKAPDKVPDEYPDVVPEVVLEVQDSYLIPKVDTNGG